jgi:signal transduction histidine kinase/CheY-like chemotaxis protein
MKTSEICRKDEGLTFLTGGGEMGERMRTLDWSRTALGPVEDWPQSLRTSVSICLNSEFPINMAWGPHLVLLYNDAFIPILGIKHPHQALGIPNRECFREIWSVIGPMLEGVLHTGKATWSEDLLLPLERSDYLEECYFTFSYSPIRDESGGLGGVFIPVKETTEKVITERRLRTLKELACRGIGSRHVAGACRIAVETLSRNPYDLSFVSLYLYDEHSKRARLAGAAGVEVGTSVSAPLIDLDPTNPERPVLADAMLEKRTEVFHRELLGALPEGIWNTAPDEVMVIPLTAGGQSSACGFLVVGVNARKRLDADYRRFLDLVAGQIGDAIAAARAHEAEKTRAEEQTQQLAEANREAARARALAEAANRAKDEFLAMLGHELRNPLSPILTATELLRMRDQDGPELQLIERQLGHLVRLVDDLLDISRITRGKIELRRETLELASIAVRGLEMASPLLVQRRQVVDFEVPAEGIRIEGDVDRLAQVVSNLITNASKYSEPDTAIRVTGERTGRSAILRVRDRGFGIAPHMLDRIFDMFVQQPQASDRSKGGLGLGLAIVRSLVELHGGTVSAASDGPGTGSEFVVELPLARDAEETRSAAAPTRRGLGTETPAAAPADGRILVVDDNQDAASTIAQVLRGLGYDVAVAHDGPSALGIAREFRPSICLLDIGLPVMDGYELAQRLREIEGLPQDFRLIAITGYGRGADQQRSKDMGFSSHLVKPVNVATLTKVLAGLRTDPA